MLDTEGDKDIEYYSLEEPHEICTVEDIGDYPIYESTSSIRHEPSFITPTIDFK